MVLRDRLEAAELLAGRLRHLRGQNPLVLAVPRGAVPMGRILAEALDGDLDVVLVRKLGSPDNPELAVGSVTESGEVQVNEVGRTLHVSDDYVRREARAQLEVLRERRRGLLGHPPADPQGRVVVVVDDGVATGATILAALRALRQARPRRLVVAVGVAPADTLRKLELAADEVACLLAPGNFRAVGQFFDDFSPVSEAEVVETLQHHREGRRRCAVTVHDGLTGIEGDLSVPEGARGVVLFSHGSGSSRRSPRNRFVAESLHARGFATLLLDLLTPDEDAFRESRFDIDLLTRRLLAAAHWLAERPDTGRLPIGLFGASTGAACALRAAAARPDVVSAVVSRGGRPDLAGEALPDVQAPTLLVVGEADRQVLALNRDALELLGSPVKRLETVPGATHLFEEPGALERVAVLAADWFAEHLAPHRAAAGGPAG